MPLILFVLLKKSAISALTEPTFGHIGFMIPVKYTDKTGKQYLFHELKQKIKNLDPNTLIHRISENHNNEIFYI